MEALCCAPTAWRQQKRENENVTWCILQLQTPSPPVHQLNV